MIPFEGNIDEVHELIKSNFTNFATDVLGIREKNHIHIADWWLEGKKKRKKKMAINQWLKDKSEGTRSINKEKKNNANEKVRIAKNEAWERAWANVISKSGIGRRKVVWSVLKVLRQQTKARATLNWYN